MFVRSDTIPLTNPLSFSQTVRTPHNVYWLRRSSARQELILLQIDKAWFPKIFPHMSFVVETHHIQTNTKTCMDIRYATLGLHQARQYKYYTKISEQSTQAHGQCTLVTLETMTSTETCKWMLCLARFRGLHKSTKEDSTIMRTLRPYSSWTARA